MSRLLSVGFAVALGLAAGAAQAGPCSEDIARIETATKQPGFQPSGTQTAAAGSDRQATPGAVQSADRKADTRFDEVMARARRLDATNDQPGCSAAVAEMKLLLGL